MALLRYFSFLAILVAVLLILDRLNTRILPSDLQHYEHLAHGALAMLAAFFAYIAWEHWRSKALRNVASEMGMQFDANGYIPFLGRRKTALSDLGEAEVIDSSVSVFNIFRISGRTTIFGSDRQQFDVTEYQTVFCFPNTLREKSAQLKLENWTTELTESTVFVYKWGYRVPVGNIKDTYRDLQSQVSKQVV